MKYNIRQRVINQYGLPVVKVEQINGELGSGLTDRNGVEIFEGDVVAYDSINGVTQEKSRVEFIDGDFVISDWNGLVPLQDIHSQVEVIGQVDGGELK